MFAGTSDDPAAHVQIVLASQDGAADVVVGCELKAKRESVFINAASRKAQESHVRAQDSGNSRVAHGITKFVVLGQFDLE